MVWKRISCYLRYAALASLAVCALTGAEHRGQVKFGGLPVPGAAVTVTQGDKKFNAVTDDQGLYEFPDLPDGIWNLEVNMLCFSPIKQEVAVTSGAPVAQWELKLLPFEEIKASAPPPPPAAPSTASAAPAANTAPAANAGPAPTTANAAPSPRNDKKGKGKSAAPAAPANGQQSFQRADVNSAGDGARAPADSTPASSTNELTPSNNDGFLINGSVNNGAASPFAQSAAFGNNRRGFRSLYNGNVGFVLGNSALDARNFSLNGQNTPKPAYNHLQGMFSYGGPLKLPKQVMTNKTPNFVVNYQLVRNRNASTPTYQMPTLLERGGDFSQTIGPAGQLLQIIDPTTGLPFPNDAIPQSRISPTATSLLRFYPLPNFGANARYNYQVGLVGTGDQDNLQTRLSKNLNNKNQIFGTFAFQRADSTSPNVFAFTDSTNILAFDATANWSHRFTNRLFGTFLFEYSRQSVRITPFFANKVNVSGEAGITGNNQEPQNWGPPNLNFTGGTASLTDANDSFARNQTARFMYNLYWNHRSHNMQTGLDVRRQQFNQLSQQNPRGSFTFTGTTTGVGYDFASFLLGVPDTSAIAFGNADKYLRATSWNGYFTDDWRVNSGFTLNAGIRYEYGTPIVEKYGRLVNLDIAPGYTAIAPVVANNPVGPLTGLRYPDSLVNPDKHGIEPRIGFAWHPILASSLVIRGGYSISFDSGIYNAIAGQMAQQSPLSKSLSVQNSASNPLTITNGFNAPPNTFTNTFAVDPNFRAGYAQNWQLWVQRDLPYALMVNANYTGIKGTRARQLFYPETYPVGAVNPCPTCPSGYAFLDSNGNSTRHALSAQLRRRLHNGFTSSLQYTWSKSIDDAALGGHGGAYLIAQNWLDLAAERALSNFDQRHLLNFSMQYSTGVGRWGGTLLDGWRGAVVKDWTITSTLTAGSGLPLSPLYPSPLRGTGASGPLRPEYTGQPLYAAPSGFFLNPAAYAAPPFGQFGNAGRNTITGPKVFTVNAQMQRTFRISERVNTDLRFDANNVLNHVTYQSWNTTFGNAQFGLPTLANAMRTLQATLRVRF